jgi:hypothetical protein
MRDLQTCGWLKVPAVFVLDLWDWAVPDTLRENGVNGAPELMKIPV